MLNTANRNGIDMAKGKSALVKAPQDAVELGW